MASASAQASTSIENGKNNQFLLKSLLSGKREAVIKTNGRITIAMIYQPDCSWCKKQGRILKKLLEQCPKALNIALIGNQGSRKQLKRELKHFDKKLSAYQAESFFLREIGGVAASPTTLFFDEQGQLIAKRRGYIPQEQFSNAVSQLTHNHCNI